ncbi:MAG: hypothetical protein ACTHQQ_21070 [Solirubrobacteraceae bacterium]
MNACARDVLRVWRPGSCGVSRNRSSSRCRTTPLPWPIDEPCLQARPDQAREYALPALNRALDGIETQTALHTCFGYAAIVKKRAHGYSFLAQLDDCNADQICLEAAQPHLDLTILHQLPNKHIVLGVLDLGNPTPETPAEAANRTRAALHHIPPHKLSISPDCGMKYLPRQLAQAKLQALVNGAQIIRADSTNNLNRAAVAVNSDPLTGSDPLGPEPGPNHRR